MVAWICVIVGFLVAVPGVWLFWREVHGGTSQGSPLGNLSSLGSYLQGAVQSLWSLVRAQLSAYELALLFYNGLSKYGEGFKPWIEEFGLLEHLDKDHLLLDPTHKVLYDKKAFK